MKKRSFKIPIYNYKCYLVEIESPKDLKRVIRILRKTDKDKSVRKRFTSNIKHDRVDGGECSYNNFKRRATIFLYRSTDVNTRLMVLGHEKRHLEDNILAWYNVKDNESSALLAGFLTQKLFKDGKKN